MFDPELKKGLAFVRSFNFCQPLVYFFAKFNRQIQQVVKQKYKIR